MTVNIFQLNTANSQVIQDGKESTWQEQPRMTNNSLDTNTLQDVSPLSIMNLNNQALC